MPKALLSLIGFASLMSTVACSGPQHLLSPEEARAAQAARRMIDASENRLTPVYGPLAEHIVATFHLGSRSGIGIDIGSGPGNLIVELCKRTRLHWINADINPHFFPHFFELAESRGVGHRVSAVLADAQALPFRDGYADIIVSRGSFQFWEDKPQAFREIYRVLRPGGVAYVGRGFSPNLPVEVARAIRSKQRAGSFPDYDVQETENELHSVMKSAGIMDYRIHVPHSHEDATVSYGIWVQFTKPLAEEP
jgi:SAM-dependent methyltransferase